MDGIHAVKRRCGSLVVSASDLNQLESLRIISRGLCHCVVT